MPEIFKAKETINDKVLEKNPSLVQTATSKKMSKFATFAVKPLGISFDTQEDDEEIFLFLRRHWITNLGWVIISFFFLLAPLTLSIFPIIEFLPFSYQLMAVIMWYLLAIAFIFEKFLNWYFNIYIVTNKRVIDYDFYNLLYKDITQAELDKIQDMSVKVGGVARVIFNYGNVAIQTAGSIPNIEFDAVPEPEEVARVIDDLRDSYQP